MANDKIDIPYGKVRIRCKGCSMVYFVDTRELKHKTEQNGGFFPCIKCGSQNTDWEFRPID